MFAYKKGSNLSYTCTKNFAQLQISRSHAYHHIFKKEINQLVYIRILCGEEVNRHTFRPLTIEEEIDPAVQ